MNPSLISKTLIDARYYLSDAIQATKLGQLTHALVSAEAALHRLSSLTSIYKNELPSTTPHEPDHQN